ncbi:MAG: hydrogenase, partial [Chloroflexi bacterium]|nr:hydrogenase [Chloroflexota bacterium]
MADNPYRPYMGTLVNVRDLATDIKLFQVQLEDRRESERFTYRPGQFAFVSAFGVGEAPFCLTSTPRRGRTLEFAVNKVGTVTEALHRLGEGDLVGVRGPFGNWFPLEEMKGKNIILLGGGIGGAPLRPIIHSVLDNRADYGKLTILWAARS